MLNHTIRPLHYQRLILSAFVALININHVIAQSSAVEWLDQTAIPIRTNEADRRYIDLLPLKAPLSDKTIIALGEATHGSKEFFQVKHRILELLVKELGYTIFGIEASFAESRAVNDYIISGRGDPEKALFSLGFWTLCTEEMLTMIDWMKEYNLDKPIEQKVKFYGFDMQYCKGSAEYIANFLDQNMPGLINKFRSVLDSLSNSRYRYFEKLPEENQKLLIGRVSDLKAELIKERQLNPRNLPQEKYDNLIQHFQILDQFFRFNQAESSSSKHDIRDRSMAENVQWILNFEGLNQRMVIWSHNSHIQKRFHSEHVAHSMGYFLSQMFQKKFYSLGFDFNRGEFLAIYKGIQVHTVGDAKARSTSAIFAQCDKPQFFFDFEIASLNPDVKVFLNKKLKSRSIGSFFKPSKENSYYMTGPLYDLYDGLIFINEVNSAIPLRPLERSNQ